MSEKALSGLTEWKPMNDRMAYACFNVYAPTLCADDPDKDKFYMELKLLIPVNKITSTER